METDYGVSPFSMMRAIGPMMVVLPMLIWMIVSGPLILYPIARWRAHRDPVLDPQLGIKVALAYFGLIAFQLVLLGGTTVLYTILSTMGSDEKSSVVRTGFGLLVPAGIVLAGHVSLLRRTNQDQFPGVRRLFVGYNFVVTGLFGFTAFVLVFEALFAKGSGGDAARLAWAGLLVYGGAWAAVGVQLGRLVLGGYSSGSPQSGPPSNLVAPPPPPAAPQGPTLPSLGGGSFPPLDSK